MVTLGVYLVFTVASGLAWNFWSLAVFRILAGAGIGGEYAAINSAIDELIPARVRGRVSLAISGSWWFGTAAAAFISYEFLSNIARRSVGAQLFHQRDSRRWHPEHQAGTSESPRWLVTHGRADRPNRW